MPGHRRPATVLTAVALVLMVALVAGCNVLFVPRKPTPAPTDSPNPALHAFPELEARLPNEVGGQTLDKFSLHSDPETVTPKTLEMLRRLGKEPTDQQFAKASIVGVDIAVVAYRIVGAEAIKAIAALEQVDESDPKSTTSYEPAVVAGKRLVIRTTGIAIEYVYPLDEVMFVISGSRALVEEALGKVH